MNLTDRKIDLILKMYVGPADENYITARSSYSNGLFHVFYWCAAQSCEKYLKAILLLQGQHAQGYGHDLAKLFQDARRNDPGNIIPDFLSIPKTTAMGYESWQGKRTSLYIDYLATYGAPDN